MFVPDEVKACNSRKRKRNEVVLVWLEPLNIQGTTRFKYRGWRMGWRWIVRAGWVGVGTVSSNCTVNPDLRRTSPTTTHGSLLFGILQCCQMGKTLRTGMA